MKRFRNIVVATDFSRASRPAFRCAVELSAATGATLWIGHVVPELPRGSVARVYGEMDVFIRRDSEKRLRALSKEAQKRGARPRVLLLRGSPPDGLRRAARARRADLLVLGTHGRTGLARFFVGSAAARVVATSPVPVLTVRRGSGRVRRILFATDFSGASQAAWTVALALAKAHRARLGIVHAVPPLALGQGLRWAYAEAEARARAVARKRLGILRDKARRAGIRAEISLVRAVPDAGILRAARSMRMHGVWIVMGTHGRTGMAAAFVGSVASRVVATAPCPVLTVRGAKRR